MKKLKFLTIAFILINITSCNAQNKEHKSIENTIREFSKAGDENNSEKLSYYLDDNYRIVMNRLFGSKEVSIMDKTTYLSKIKSKEYGGDNRILTIENIVINGTSASVKVTFKGTKMKFVSLITLIKSDDNNWKLIGDIPTIE